MMFFTKSGTAHDSYRSRARPYNREDAAYVDPGTLLRSGVLASLFRWKKCANPFAAPDIERGIDGCDQP
jgi:hypothetical protein